MGFSGVRPRGAVSLARNRPSGIVPRTVRANSTAVRANHPNFAGRLLALQQRIVALES